MIPEHTHIALVEYKDNGKPIGHFLTAVLTNDLFESFQRADEKNIKAMKEIVNWVYWEMPSIAWGTKEKINAWIEQGGEKGLRPLAVVKDEDEQKLEE
jgi:hypothetical protein